jgi:mRNA interferase MazF
MSAGDVVLVDLDPASGHEQKGQRPFLVLSDQRLRSFVIGVPLTRTDRGWPVHVRLNPGEPVPSVALCDQVRSLDAKRVKKVLGRVSRAQLESVRALVAQLIGA